MRVPRRGVSFWEKGLKCFGGLYWVPQLRENTLWTIRDPEPEAPTAETILSQPWVSRVAVHNI